LTVLKETTNLLFRIKSIQTHAISSESDLVALLRGLSLEVRLENGPRARLETTLADWHTCTVIL
jgi:hypothetical protein